MKITSASAWGDEVHSSSLQFTPVPRMLCKHTQFITVTHTFCYTIYSKKQPYIPIELNLLPRASFFDLVRFLFGIIFESERLHSRCFTSKKWRILPPRAASKVTRSGQVMFWNGTPPSLWKKCRRPLTAPTSARCATAQTCRAVTGRSCSKSSTKVRAERCFFLSYFSPLFLLYV